MICILRITFSSRPRATGVLLEHSSVYIIELHHIPSWFANVSFFFGSEFSVSLQTTSSGFPLLFFLFFGETVWVSTVENRFGKKSFKWQVLLKKDLTIEEYVGDWRKFYRQNTIIPCMKGSVTVTPTSSTSRSRGQVIFLVYSKGTDGK